MKRVIKTFAIRRRLISALATGASMQLKTKLLLALLIFVASYTTKSLQAADLAPLMYTAEQPFNGLTQTYDLRAQSILDGEGLLGPYDIEPSRTVWLAHAPGYSIFLSGVYKFFDRDFFKVQLAQNAFNSISPILIFLIAGSVISWRVGVVSGLLAALSHHMSHISNFILPDSLAALPVLTAVYLIVMARRYERRTFWLYAMAGAMLGLSAWLRPQTMLMGLFLIMILAAISIKRRTAIKRAAVMAAISILVIAPITIKNYLVYGQFVPINIGVGQVLWAGLGDTDRGKEFGAVPKDHEIAAQEAVLYNDPRYGEVWSSPDGIKRDRDRVKKSLGIIVKNPFWYSGLMLKRMGRMLKYSADAPLVFRASQTTSLEPTLPVRREWKDMRRDPSSLAFAQNINWTRPAIRASQRLTKETMLPFILIGAAMFFIAAPRRAIFIFAMPLYYFIFQSFLHTEFRYTLPMQYFLFVFAAIAWVLLVSSIWTSARRLYKKRKDHGSEKHVSENAA